MIPYAHCFLKNGLHFKKYHIRLHRDDKPARMYSGEIPSRTRYHTTEIHPGEPGPRANNHPCCQIVSQKFLHGGGFDNRYNPRAPRPGPGAFLLDIGHQLLNLLGATFHRWSCQGIKKGIYLGRVLAIRLHRESFLSNCSCLTAWPVRDVD